jgi:uncharacterized membrane protein
MWVLSVAVVWLAGTDEGLEVQIVRSKWWRLVLLLVLVGLGVASWVLVVLQFVFPASEVVFLARAATLFGSAAIGIVVGLLLALVRIVRDRG